MLSSPRRFFVLLLLSAAFALPLRSQEAPFAKKSPSTKMSGSQKSPTTATEGKKAVDLKKMDLSSLPAEAVIVICEHADEALDLLPKAVLLRPEKYQALLDQIAKLKKEIEKRRSESSTPPTRCSLRGKVESGFVHMEAEFSGMAEHADTVVALACSQAAASSAVTDGRLALIRRSESGAFLVRIEKPGEYHVKLDLLLPLAAREGARRGFELTLPRAVITQLDLDLPDNCLDVRSAGQRLKDLQQLGLELKNNHLRGNLGLGPVDRLDLNWTEARHSTNDSIRTAEGRIQARLDGAGLTTEADLWLVVEGAAAQDWRLLVPRNAEIKVLPSDKEAPVEHRIETADQKFASLRTIRLKEANTEPLHVQVKVPVLPLPSSGSTLPIGPFYVLDAVRQTGTVRVSNQVRNLHLDYRGHGDMQLRRQQTVDMKGEAPATMATFVYSNIPMVADPVSTIGPRSRSWLDLEAVIVPAQVRMRTSHTLTLRTSGTPDKGEAGRTTRQWEILTTISPATKWNDIEQLKILVPPNWMPIDENFAVPEGGPFAANQRIRQGGGADNNPRWLTIPSFLLRGAPTQSQRIQGRYQASYKADERAFLKLPRPQGPIETCEIKIEAPADTEVVLSNAEHVDLELNRQQRPNEQTWRCRNLPADGLGIEVSWRPYRPELRVLSEADLTLSDNSGEVRQELRLQLPATPPASVTLRVPAAIGESLQIKDDQGQEVHSVKIDLRNSKSRTPSSDSDFGLRIPVPTKTGGAEWRLILQYRFSLVGFREPERIDGGSQDQKPDARNRQPEPFSVPLVAVEQATGGDSRVRIWSESGFLPRAASPSWEVRNIEEVKGHDLPVLVLHTILLDAPLKLIVGEQAPGLAVLVERSQMSVQLLEGGALNWRASFQLRQLADRILDILLPSPVTALNARFFLNGNRVTPEIVNVNGEQTVGGYIARLHLSPNLVRQTSLLEVSFQSPPGRSGVNRFRSVLQPPQLLRATVVPTFWQVSLPADRVLLAPESGAAAERTWTRKGWLFAASLSPLIPSTLAPLSESDKSWMEGKPLALACWQDQAVPIVLTHAPQQGWLLVCSLGLLIFGLGLYWLARSPANGGGRVAVWFWPLLALLTLAIAIAALFWPTAVYAVAYGCEPGVVVLLAVLCLQWLMHERYRRQIVFLPSFSRSPSGSSLIRKTSSNRAHSGEPSTVDAPPPVG